MTSRRRDTCLHCDTPLSASQQKGRKTYCAVQCAYDHRPTIAAEARQQAELQAARDRVILQAWLRELRHRKARTAYRKAA